MVIVFVAGLLMLVVAVMWVRSGVRGGSGEGDRGSRSSGLLWGDGGGSSCDSGGGWFGGGDGGGGGGDGGGC
jgi:hypothetical protein